MLQFALLSVSLHAAGASATTAATSPPADQVRAASAGLALAGAYFGSIASPDDGGGEREAAAWRDCARLYEDSGSRLRLLAAGGGRSIADARTWLSGAVTSHRTCMDGLREQGLPPPPVQLAENLTRLLTTALRAYHEKDDSGEFQRKKKIARSNQTFPWKRSNGQLFFSRRNTRRDPSA